LGYKILLAPLDLSYKYPLRVYSGVYGGDHILDGDMKSNSKYTPTISKKINDAFP
jgi:hypothetical protein